MTLSHELESNGGQAAPPRDGEPVADLPLVPSRGDTPSGDQPASAAAAPAATGLVEAGPDPSLPAVWDRSGRHRAVLDDIILGHIQDAVFATDLENRITYWAASAVRLFGYAPDEALGRPFGELLPFEIADKSDETSFLATLAQGRTWRGEGAVRLRDGSKLWIESTVDPVTVEGQIVGSVSVSRDMTRAVEAQRRLEAQQQFLDAVLDVAGFLVLVLDACGCVVRFNRACERLTGYDFAAVAGRPVWGLLVPEAEKPLVQAAMGKARAGENAWPEALEHHVLTRSGAKRLISWSLTSLLDEAGEVTYIIGAGRDVTEERRAADALRGIEAIGRLLTKQGPTPETLDAIVGSLSAQMGYPYLTLLLRDGEGLRLGGQRGYADLPRYFPPRQGVVGRVLRTGHPAFVPDVARDPDYRPIDASVRSEIAVPLTADDQILGILNIEATDAAPLTENDLRLAQTVADRISSALLLGREQQDLSERARMFAGLNEFARVANSMLRSDRLWPELIEAVCRLVPADMTILTSLEPSTGRYVVRAVRGLDEHAVGMEIGLGEGSSGKAIASRTLVITEHTDRSTYPRQLRQMVSSESLTTAAIPLIREGAVLGAITVGRATDGPAFSELDCEVITLLGAQAALALANAQLLEEVSELALHDALTGLFNRRHLDASLDHIVARWQRDRDPDQPVAAIMFDLDHFGRFNNDHGHQAGDVVLRVFAGILRQRLRSSDLVARYGGEEFVAILEGCSLADAVEIAEDVRMTLEARAIDGPEGEQLRARVSAGCAVLDPAEPTKEALLRAADVGLFMAKRGGRNRVLAA